MKQETATLTRLLMLLATGGALVSCGVRHHPQTPPAGNTGKFDMSSVDTVPRHYGRFKRYIPKPIGIDRIHLCTTYKDISGMTRNPIHRVSPWQRAAGDRIEWTVTSATGTLPTYRDYRVAPCAFAAWDPFYMERFVVGRADQAYTVVVRNRSKNVLEIEVVSNIGRPPERSRDIVTRRAVEAGATLRVRGTIVACCDLRSFRFPSATDVGSVSIRVFDSRTTSIEGFPAAPDQFPPYR